MTLSIKARINRLFGEDGRCLDVAIDHGAFNEYSFLDGITDMAEIVRQLVEAGPDAIQMNYGQSDLLQSMKGKNKPALVMRTDSGNPYNAKTHRVMFNILQNSDEPILEALRMDAACVVVNLLLLPDEPDLHRQTIHNISRLRGACDKYGMPLMIEPLVMKTNDSRGGYQVDGDKETLVALVRQARELGADIIKADPTDNVEDYHEVIMAARCPVLVRGGGKTDLKTVFERSYGFLQQGAVGLVYGRNIFQHPNPHGVVQALMSMIHEDKTPDEAWTVYQQTGEKTSA